MQSENESTVENESKNGSTGALSLGVVSSGNYIASVVTWAFAFEQGFSFEIHTYLCIYEFIFYMRINVSIFCIKTKCVTAQSGTHISFRPSTLMTSCMPKYGLVPLQKNSTYIRKYAVGLLESVLKIVL